MTKKNPATLTYGIFTFHKPRLLPILITLIAVGMCMGLGIWQIQRLQWKQDLIAKLEVNQKGRVIGLKDVPDDLNELTKQEFHMVSIPGEFDHTHEFHLMGQRYRGQLGYDILTPFNIAENGGQILVNRGWVPTSKKKPEDRPEDPRFSGLIFLKGILLVPEKGNWLLPENDAEQNVWLYYDIAGMNAVSGLNLPPVVVDMVNAAPAPNVLPIPRESSGIELRNDHFGYAMMWFSLAFAGIVIFLVYHLKSVEGDDE